MAVECTVYTVILSFSALLSGAGGDFRCSEHVANILPSGPLTWFKVEHTCRLANYADSFRVNTIRPVQEFRSPEVYWPDVIKISSHDTT